MFNQVGLSLEQAPPISVVLRFFVTASIFGIVLGIFFLLYDFNLISFSLYSFKLIVIHVLSLGIVASFMLGAMFQMLPVLAGVIITFPIKQAMVAHTFLTFGLILQIIAFKTTLSVVYLVTATILGSGLLYISLLMFKKLLQIKNHSNSSKGMILALGSFILTIIFGTIMLLTLGEYIDNPFFSQMEEVHYSFALFGWITLLIISISFQVVEMFYVTPKYPNIISKYFTISIFIMLVLKMIMLFSGLNIRAVDVILSILFIIYAFTTIYRLYQRRRPTSDATVWFWRLGMICLIVTSSAILIDTTFLEIKYISFVGFVLSIIFAMVYKIVPFLIWFHLSTQGYMEAPMMHDVIHPEVAKIHFYIHISLLSLLIINIFLDIFMLKILLDILLVLSFGLLLYNLLYAINKYRYTRTNFKPIKW
jgi:hypothetical protein